ncbi:uncharacterized protein LOC119192750 [Manduca sexta]|uniref:uncharacterized protein LOC119192750 n=1 Tax=Manduca sexta TaxID=7130 RepID=UPI001890931E|nr:uncharacterized protein LOC119192750 [Manduca sexta]
MAEALDQGASIFQKLAMYDYRIGERYWVDVTHIVNPYSFYVRPVVFREDLEYLQETCDHFDPGMLQEGKIIIYKSEFLDLYVRGSILKVIKEDGDIKCDIKAIDYGSEDNTVPLWRMRHPKHEIAIPPLAAHCVLADCKSLDPGTWAEETIEAMKSYVGNERARMTVKGRTGDQLVVELVNSCPNDIATMLTLTGYTAMGSSAEMPGGNRANPPFDGRYFGCKLVKVGDVLHVRCQTGKDLSGFYVAEVGDFNQYLSDRNDFTDYCIYQKTPRANELVIGRVWAISLNA